jgi:hypothetical protein
MMTGIVDHSGRALVEIEIGQTTVSIIDYQTATLSID